jgi:hypothetical protein
VLRRLLTEDRLPTWIDAYRDVAADRTEGNCHDVALALMTDLVVAGQAAGWHWVRARVRNPSGVFFHSWLEYDGWAVDAAIGKCLVADAQWYRRAFQARDVELRDADATRDWLECGWTRE